MLYRLGPCSPSLQGKVDIEIIRHCRTAHGAANVRTALRRCKINLIIACVGGSGGRFS